MDGTYTKGQHLLLETEEGVVEGRFHSMSDCHQQLTLTAVVLQPSGEELQGLCHYYANEVKSVRLLEPGTTNEQQRENEAAQNYYLMRRVPAPINPGRVPSILKDCDIVANYNPHQHGPANSWRKNQRNALENFKKLYEITQRYIYVEEIELFEKAIMVISKEPVIALEMVGVNLGWADRIGLLNVATEDRTILLDIQKLGSHIFDIGLREILESNEIIKVVHNCQMLSDFLQHEHGVQLHNVFDTQVADLIHVLGRYGALPMVTRSIQECLGVQLGVPECLTHKLEVRNGYIDIDLSVWMYRPLHLMRRQAAVKNAVFLLPLRRKLMDDNPEMLARGTEILMTVVRDADRQVAKQCQAKFFLVPVELQELVEKSKQYQRNQ